MLLPCLFCDATGISNSLDITFTFSSITLVVPDALGLAKQADKGQQFSIWRKPGAGCTGMINAGRVFARAVCNFHLHSRENFVAYTTRQVNSVRSKHF